MGVMAMEGKGDRVKLYFRGKPNKTWWVDG